MKYLKIGMKTHIKYPNIKLVETAILTIVESNEQRILYL